MPTLLSWESFPPWHWSRAVFGRKVPIVTSCRQRSSVRFRSSSSYGCHTGTVINALLLDDESAVLTDDLPQVRDYTSVARWTLVCTCILLIILVKPSLLDLPECHRSHQFSPNPLEANPSPFVETIAKSRRTHVSRRQSHIRNRG